TSWSEAKSFFDSLIAVASLMVFPSRVEEPLDTRHELGDLERPTLHLVHADRVDQELRTENLDQLPHVQFGHEHLLESPEDVGHVGRQRIQMSQMYVADRLAAIDQLLH